MSGSEVYDPRRWTPAEDDPVSERAVARAKLLFAALSIERLKDDLKDLQAQLEVLDIANGLDVLQEGLEDVDQLVMQELLGPTIVRAMERDQGMRRCEDCGIRLDRHGSECGMEIDDPRAEGYFPPAGWARPTSPEEINVDGR
jgi:hypothetical protein